VDNGMTDETLGATQQFLRNYTIPWGSTIGRRLAYKVDDAFYGVGGQGFLASIRPGVAALQLDQVNASIKKHLQYDNLYIAFITRDAEEMKEKLLTGVATHTTYNSPQSDEHMAEDEEIANFPIPIKEENITIITIDEVFEKK
jgi:zinc protease